MEAIINGYLTALIDSSKGLYQFRDLYNFNWKFVGKTKAT